MTKGDSLIPFRKRSRFRPYKGKTRYFERREFDVIECEIDVHVGIGFSDNRLYCEGGFSHVLSFESKPEQTVSLLDMASQCLEITKGDTAALVMAAETAGLVGAALRRSPAMAETGADPFCHPEIRDWMTFTTEPAYTRGVALVAGVISRGGSEALAPIVRPLGEDPWPVGHFHGAAFSYRPLRKGRVDLVDTVRALFEEEMLNGILDLINDTRPIVGVGQSQFVRGTCWMAPVSNMERVIN